MKDTYRFRYLLATPTIEKGSPVIEYNIERLLEGERTRFKPERFIGQPEFLAFKKGLISFQEKSLCLNKPSVSINNFGVIDYLLSFTSTELFSRIIYEEGFLEKIIKQRKIISPKIIKLIQSIADISHSIDMNELLSLADHWHAYVALLFENSIPTLLTDELIFRSFESKLSIKVPDYRKRMEIIKDIYKSSYVKSIASGEIQCLPESKVWNRSPAKISILKNPEKYDTNHSAYLNIYILHDIKFIDQNSYESRIFYIVGDIFKLSEETHYLLGGLLLAGNHLWINIESRLKNIRITKKWLPMPISEIKKIIGEEIMK